MFDGPTVQSTTESGERAGYDGHKRRNGSKTHLAVDTRGLLLATHVTPANEQERETLADTFAECLDRGRQSSNFAMPIRFRR